MPFLLLAASLAAPVPLDTPAAREQLESLWADLASDDPIKRTRAAFALVDHPAAVEFLAKKCPPVKATENQLRGWLADLNSNDETEWKPAFDQLRYFDPRLALTLYDQSDLATTDQGRRLLASLWYGSDEGIQAKPDALSNSLTWRGPFSRWVTFDQKTARGGLGHTFPVKRVEEMTPAPWRSAALAAVVLDRLDTPSSRTALDRLASGHPNALPTRTAATVRRARFALPPLLQLDPVWPKLLDPDPVESTRWAFALADRPDLVRGLKVKLPTINATKAEVTGWLKALNSEKTAVWRPAYEKLLYFRPTLALSFDEQCDLITTPHGELALCELWMFDDRVPDRVGVREIGGGRGPAWEFREWVSIDLLRNQILNKNFDPLDQTKHSRWQRARLAVAALERVNTPDAKSVLKQLAAGDPDILPTKEAKAALKR